MRAKKTNRLYDQLVAPSVAAFNILLRQNLMKNCEVTEKGIELTYKVFGQDVPTLKGRSNWPKLRQVVGKEIKKPDKFVARNSIYN